MDALFPLSLLFLPFFIFLTWKRRERKGGRDGLAERGPFFMASFCLELEKAAACCCQWVVVVVSGFLAPKVPLAGHLLTLAYAATGNRAYFKGGCE